MARNCPPVDSGRLQRAARCLSPLEREALVFSVASDLSIASVAERLAVSSADAERLLADALYKLDQALLRQERPWWRFW